MAKKKFYAIKVGRGTKNKIVQSWDECKEIISGFNSTYKGFATLEEAEEYLGISKNKELEETKIKFQEAVRFDLDIFKSKDETAKTEIPVKHKSNTTYLKGIGIPNDLYMLFEQKCKKLDIEQETIIKELIKEWLL